MESIDSLARAINSFSGGMVLVSHDMRLISQVAKEIWICDHRKVEKFNGEIEDFKMRIRTGLGLGAGSAPKSENVPKAPLAPVAMAPPLPPVAKAADKEEDENDALLKSRLELAEIAIQKQRARQAAEVLSVAGPIDRHVKCFERIGGVAAAAGRHLRQLYPVDPRLILRASMARNILCERLCQTRETMCDIVRFILRKEGIEAGPDPQRFIDEWI